MSETKAGKNKEKLNTTPHNPSQDKSSEMFYSNSQAILQEPSLQSFNAQPSRRYVDAKLSKGGVFLTQELGAVAQSQSEEGTVSLKGLPTPSN